MKKLSLKEVPKFVLLFVFSAMQIIAFSQDTLSHTTTSVNTKTTSSFEVEPWMWVVGGAVLLVILLALLRGNSTTEVSKTTIIKK